MLDPEGARSSESVVPDKVQEHLGSADSGPEHHTFIDVDEEGWREFRDFLKVVLPFAAIGMTVPYIFRSGSIESQALARPVVPATDARSYVGKEVTIEGRLQFLEQQAELEYHSVTNTTGGDLGAMTESHFSTVVKGTQRYVLTVDGKPSEVMVDTLFSKDLRGYDKSTSAGLIEPPFTLEDYRDYVTTRITPEVLDFLGAESRIGTERVRAVSGLLQTDVEDRLILKSDYLFEREEF